MLKIDLEKVDGIYESLKPSLRDRIDDAVEVITQAKLRGGKVVVTTGSGPNVHEGVTTLIAELMDKGIVDGVSTSSAVVAHEMAGVLDNVKRVDGAALGMPSHLLPRGGKFEVTLMSEGQLEALSEEMPIDRELIDRVMGMDGDIIIKAAGNMGYPMGLRTERLAREIGYISAMLGQPFERVAGFGADSRTMIGIGSEKDIPVIVSTPQLVGGGTVGISIADSIPASRRVSMFSEMLGEADVIIESALALAQEIHDGPFETYTGHGIWSAWDGYPTFSLEGKGIIRIDLDPNLEEAWKRERSGSTVQMAVDKGLPKTKLTGIPFRMEMSGFARIEGSIPLVGDIGAVWPVMVRKVALKLGIDLDFISYPQEMPEGKRMREWIVDDIKPIDRKKVVKRVYEGSAELVRGKELTFLKA